MRAGTFLLLFLALLLTNQCHTRRLRRGSSVRLLQKLSHMSRQLGELRSSLALYDKELSDIISAESAGNHIRKRSADNDYVSELRGQRRLVQLMRNVFEDTQRNMDRQKKWSTCNLNLGFTCQTEQYNEIANYFDYLNSVSSPGKKRSVPSYRLAMGP